MKQWKALVGVALMAAAVVGMVLWEGWGRDALLLTDVVVAAEDIAGGQLIKEENLTVLGVPEDCLVQGAVPAENMAELTGKYAVSAISANQQICEREAAAEEQVVGEGETAFVIPQEWIAMRSSSLRRGDTVTLYRLSDYSSLGSYAVAFVKDDDDREVYSLEGVDDEKLLDRTDSSMPVDHVEILAKLAEYQVIRQAAQEDGGLLVVQGKGGQP